MTLGRLMELYQAEEEGKQIMQKEYRPGYYSSYERITEVKISDCDLSTFVDDDSDDEFDYKYIYFIKDEEDKYGDKINKE